MKMLIVTAILILLTGCAAKRKKLDPPPGVWQTCPNDPLCQQ